MSIDSVTLWHKRARPTLSAEGFNVQLGCHLEEVVEMLDSLCFQVDGQQMTMGKNTVLRNILNQTAEALKSGMLSATVNDRKEFLDSIADQIVTGAGAGVCAGMNVPGALAAVDSSNWSKFVDGMPVFNEQGKIKKGPNYKAPDLTGLY